MEKLESIIFITVVGTLTLISVCFVTPYAIKGLNVVAENVCNTSINVDLTSQYVSTSLCKFIVVATGLTIVNILSDGLFLNIVSSLGNGFSDGDIFAASAVNVAPIIQPVQAVIETLIIDPIRYTSLRDSINSDLILLKELKPVTTILNSSAYGLLNTCILVKALNHGFFFSPEYFKTGVGYYDFYSEFLESTKENAVQFINNQPILRKLYLKESLNYYNIDYKLYIDMCKLESVNQAQAQLVEAMQVSCNLGTLSLEELILRNTFGLYLYSKDSTLFDALFLRSAYTGKLVLFNTFISFYDFSIINHIAYQEDMYSYYYNMSLLIEKSKVMKAIIYLTYMNR